MKIPLFKFNLLHLENEIFSEPSIVCRYVLLTGCKRLHCFFVATMFTGANLGNALTASPERIKMHAMLLLNNHNIKEYNTMNNSN